MINTRFLVQETPKLKTFNVAGPAVIAEDAELVKKVKETTTVDDAIAILEDPQTWQNAGLSPDNGHSGRQAKYFLNGNNGSKGLKDLKQEGKGNTKLKDLPAGSQGAYPDLVANLLAALQEWIAEERSKKGQ